MKTTVGLTIMAVLLAACGSGNDQETTFPGVFKGRVGDKDYELAVQCLNFEKSYFLFLSDETDYADSNGDGIVLSGMQDGKEMNFMIEDQGESYGSISLERFIKSRNGARAAGTLRTLGSEKVLQAQFSVDCG